MSSLISIFFEKIFPTSAKPLPYGRYREFVFLFTSGASVLFGGGLDRPERWYGTLDSHLRALTNPALNKYKLSKPLVMGQQRLPGCPILARKSEIHFPIYTCSKGPAMSIPNPMEEKISSSLTDVPTILTVDDSEIVQKSIKRYLGTPIKQDGSPKVLSARA